MGTARRLRVEPVAWLAAFIPLTAANAAYLISASHGLIEWCFPYLEGCTSVSRAARQMPAALLFKGLMLPYSALLMLFWWMAAEWLRGFAPGAIQRRRAIFWLGQTGAVFLILYVIFLGVDGEVYQWLRRYGINLHFGTTVLAEMLLMSIIASNPAVRPRIHRTLTGLCLVMLALGIASLPLQFIVADRDALLNAIEWTFATLMVLYFPVVGRAWHQTDFQLRPVLRRKNRV